MGLLGVSVFWVFERADVWEECIFPWLELHDRWWLSWFSGVAAFNWETLAGMLLPPERARACERAYADFLPRYVPGAIRSLAANHGLQLSTASNKRVHMPMPSIREFLLQRDEKITSHEFVVGLNALVFRCFLYSFRTLLMRDAVVTGTYSLAFPHLSGCSIDGELRKISS